MFFLIAPPIVYQGRVSHCTWSSVVAVQLVGGILCPYVLGTGLQVGHHTHCHLLGSEDLNFSSKAYTAMALLAEICGFDPILITLFWYL